jgi:hypothetical protein
MRIAQVGEIDCRPASTASGAREEWPDALPEGGVMIVSALQSAGAGLAGLVVAFIFVIGVEGMSSVLHPLPPGVNPSEPEAIRAHVARYPAGVLLLAGLGWGLGTFVSSWLATRLGTRRHLAHGIAVGSILLALAVVNMLMLPYPIWFWVLNLVLFPAGCYAGARLGRGRISAGHESDA